MIDYTIGKSVSQYFTLQVEVLVAFAGGISRKSQAFQKI